MREDNLLKPLSFLMDYMKGEYMMLKNKILISFLVFLLIFSFVLEIEADSSKVNKDKIQK